MRISAPVFLCGLLGALALGGCAAAPVPVPDSPAFYDNLSRGGQVDSQAAAEMISDYRRARGLSAVTVDPILTEVAQKQAKLMASKDELSHSVGGRTFTLRLKAAGFDGLKAAENVGAGYHTLAEAFSGWRDSPSHNKNMLMPGVTRIGIATALAPNSKYKVYWALVLAAPDPRAGQPPAAPAQGGPAFDPAPTSGAASAPGATGGTTVSINGATLGR